MPAPLDQQAEFAEALLDPKRDMPLGLVSYASLRPARRFAVYRNNVVMGLIEALKSTYPVIARLLGDEFFHAVAREFIVDHPPRSPILSRYGSAFPDFLRQFPPVADLPYLGDVAQLEWTQLRAYHSADSTPLTLGQLQRVAPDRIARLVFELHPSVAILESPYPIFSIWRTNTQDDVVERIDAHAGGECVVVVRRHLDMYVLKMDKAGLAMIHALRSGETLAASAQAALAIDPLFDLQAHLALLIEHGAFVDIAYTPVAPD